MTSISVYQIQEQFFKKTFGNFVTKVYENDNYSTIICHDSNEVSLVDDILWTFSQLSFLPHHTDKDEIDCVDLKSIYIGTELKNNYDSRIFMSPELVVSGGKKIYVIDRGSADIDKLESHFQSNPLKIFSQNGEGKWEQRI